MWAVWGGHLEHARILIELGAEPMISTDDGEDALSFAARLHLATLLRYLLENTRPIRVRGHLSRLTEATLGGESRFKRMTRHGERWITAAGETLQVLKEWHILLSEGEKFTTILLPALRLSLKTPYGAFSPTPGLEMSLARPCSFKAYLLLAWNYCISDDHNYISVEETDCAIRKRSHEYRCASRVFQR